MADAAMIDPGRATPTPEEIAEIMSDLSFFLEMDEATALVPEEEVTGETDPTRANDGTGEPPSKGGK